MTKNRLKNKISNLFYDFSLIGLGFLIIFLIVLLKSKTSSDFWSSPLLLIYTIFITSFELSRLISAAMYSTSNRNILKTGRINMPEEDYEPSVSFVIPCKNEGESIGMTIDKCFEADYPAEKLEVIIINDGSTDNTIDVLLERQKKYKKLVIVDWKVNKGKRHGMYEGFNLSTGEIIIQLDSDSYIEPKDVRKIIEPFRNPEIGAVCAHADPMNAGRNILTKMQAAYYFMSFRILKAAESTFMSVFCCSGCSSAYRKNIVMPILDEWLNETFLGLPVTWGDDRALTNMVIREGYRTIYTADVQAYTICPEKLRQFLKQQVRWKKGWFVNSFFASKFILKKEPFVAVTYFFPLIFVTLLTPFMATKALIINPIFHNISPWFYLCGVFLVSFMIIIFYRWFSRDNKYWPYIFIWSLINVSLLSFILFYALATLNNRKWGTR